MTDHGYHNKPIGRGILGEYSKISEEYQEACDAYDSRNPVMLLLELSDLIGAIEAYTVLKHQITLDDLLQMKDVTKRAFAAGERK